MRAILIGCTFLLVVGCAGTRSEAPQEEQGHTEVTKEQTHSDQCEGTRTVDLQGRTYTTNDVSGCSKGGMLSGTDKPDKLDGEDGDDEIRGLGAIDWILGGSGSDDIYGGDGDDSLQGDDYWGEAASTKDVLHGGLGNDDMGDFDGGDDVLYGGDGDDSMLVGGKGEDVIYGGDGNDVIEGTDADLYGGGVRKQRDELYSGEGRDKYIADDLDYVDSTCEVKLPPSNL